MIIQFESSTSCNAKCSFCPRDFSRPKGQMSDELFYKIIDEGKKLNVSKFLPFLNGEPFMFSRIFSWLEYMEKQNIKVHLYSNCSLLDKEKIDFIVSLGCIEYIYCSFNGAKKETYEKIMRLDYEKTKKNINYLLDKAKFPVRVGMVLTKETYKEKERFTKMWRGKVKFSPFKNWCGIKHDPLERTGKRISCRQVRQHFTILWDGRVCLCCFDYDGKVILGDLNKQSIKEIWDSAKLIRDKHNSLDFNMPLCRECNFNLSG